MRLMIRKYEVEVVTRLNHPDLTLVSVVRGAPPT